MTAVIIFGLSYLGIALGGIAGMALVPFIMTSDSAYDFQDYGDLFFIF